MALTETITVTRPVDHRIADLVYFAKYLVETGKDPKTMTDDQLVASANSFWDRQHGED